MGDETEFLLWAHQGGAREGPSNTLAAMHRAISTAGGANALECDVHRSSDGHLVVLHDRTLGRTTSGGGKVSRYGLAALRMFDAAYWWVPGKVDDHHSPAAAYTLRGRGPADPHYRIPTLGEVLDAFPGVPFTIEVKGWRAARPLVDVLAARDRRDVTIVSFFDPILWGVRWRMRHWSGKGWTAPLAPATGAMVWFTLRTRLGFPPGRSRYTRMQVPVTKLGIRFADQKLVDACHAADMEVDVWTIDDEPTMAELFRLGVDGIMTDCPSVLAKARRDHLGRPTDS